MKRKDLVGQTFGELTVIEFAGFYNRHTHWNCSCSCGGEALATSCNLVRGNTLSCGCLQKRRTSEASKTHGLSKHKVYNVWRGMINRCELPNHISYSNYGGKGISVSKEWHDFETFIKDMGLPPEGRFDIDRIDNSKGYQKGNCRWITRKGNSRNTSKTVMVEWENTKQPLITLGERYGINYKCLHKRIRSGWSIEDALLVPSGGKRPKVG